MQSFGLEQKSFQNLKAKAALVILVIACLFVYIMLFLLNNGVLLPNNLNTELRVDFINVGHGDAILIKTPMGKVFLVDGGPTAHKKAKSTGLVAEYLKKQGITQLDGIIVSCYRGEYLNGLIPVLSNFKVGYIVEPPGSGKGVNYARFAKLCEEKKIAKYKVNCGDIIEWGNELFCQVLSPEEAVGKANYSDIGNNSLVLFIKYGKFRLLLASGAEKHALARLMPYGEALRCQVIKAPAHGSKATDFEPFVKLVQPKTAIFCVGRKNPFDCPHEKVLSYYGKIGAKILRTDLNGTIKLFAGGKTEDDYRLVSDFI